MIKIKLRIFLSAFIGFFIASCGSYKQNVLFTVEESNWVDSIRSTSQELNHNYTVQPNDYLDIKVYANGGELIIDPNFELRKELGTTGGTSTTQEEPIRYLVQADSSVNLPMVGKVKVGGYSTVQLDSLLQQRYTNYYESPFVITKVTNRRVIVMGAQKSKIVPLNNENINLIEVLALYGGISNDERGHNIRLIRGDLKNPQVQIIDLTTIEGMRKASLKIKSNDIIYIEPIRKPIVESIRDASPIIGLVTSLITLIFVLSIKK